MDKNLQKLQRLLSLMDEDTLTKEDFLKSFENVVKLVKKIEDKNNIFLDELTSSYQLLKEKLQATHSESISGIKNEFIAKTEDILKRHNDSLTKIEDKLLEVKDGKDADEEKIINEVLNKIKLPEQKEVILDDAFEIRNKLETLNGDDRLTADAISGLEEKIEAKSVKITGGGGARGVRLYVDGVKKGLCNTINLIGGTNVSLTYSKAFGRNDITISVASSALTVLTATGTIDNFNVVFTFASEPVLVVVNGASYRHGKGCTIASTTVTLDAPVGTGGDIYGLG